MLIYFFIQTPYQVVLSLHLPKNIFWNSFIFYILHEVN